MNRITEIRASTLLALCALVSACGDGLTDPNTPDLHQAPPDVISFVEQMNAHRNAEGCSSLAWHTGVADVATAHSQDMIDRDFFDHTNPDGDNPFERLANAGVTWSGGAGENILAGTSDATLVLNLWLGSSGHRANIENCGFTHHGVGLVSGYWTHVFVTNPD